MELHASDSPALERDRSTFSFPHWSKTGRRTRNRKALVLIPSSHRALIACYTEALAVENVEPTKENLPPKKRKELINDGNNEHIANPGPESSRRFQSEPERKHHRCEVCDRPFKSYQALGGHKAHHHNKPINGFSRPVSAERQCPFCYKMFSKGQALGGHKRHCRRRDRPVKEGGQVGRDKILGFDLNELPSECLGP